MRDDAQAPGGHGGAVIRRSVVMPDDAGPGLPGRHGYVLDEQIGFILRRAHQRSSAIFQQHIPALTPTQFAVLAKLREQGPLSQNHLGRLTAMDAATIQALVGRLLIRGLISRSADPDDRRCLLIDLTPEGEAMVDGLIPDAAAATRDILLPLSPKKRELLLHLLELLC